MLKSADSEEDDDELVSRLSPFDEMPSSSTTPTATSNLRSHDDTSRRSSLAREEEKRRGPLQSVSRVSVTTTSTRGDEFFDS